MSSRCVSGLYRSRNPQLHAPSIYLEMSFVAAIKPRSYDLQSISFLLQRD